MKSLSLTLSTFQLGKHQKKINSANVTTCPYSDSLASTDPLARTLCSAKHRHRHRLVLCTVLQLCSGLDMNNTCSHNQFCTALLYCSCSRGGWDFLFRVILRFYLIFCLIYYFDKLKLCGNSNVFLLHVPGFL